MGERRVGDRRQLPKAYLRIDPNIDQHPDPTAMLLLICAAARQPKRGHFRTLRVLHSVIGRKKVQDCINRKDITLLEDGSYYLVGWNEWNEGDLTVGERVRRVRERRYSAVTSACPDRFPPSEALGRKGVRAYSVPPGEPASQSPPPERGDAPAPPAPAPRPVVERKNGWGREACDDWIARTGGTAPGGRIVQALKPLVEGGRGREKLGWPEVRPAWRYYLAAEEPKYLSPESFAAKFGVWRTRMDRGGEEDGRTQRTLTALANWAKRGGEEAS